MVAASDLARLYAQAGGAVMAAEQVAERMRRAEDQRVARQAKEEEERKAEWLASGGTIEELLHRAAGALNYAKGQGGNRVVVAQPVPKSF